MAHNNINIEDLIQELNTSAPTTNISNASDYISYNQLKNMRHQCIAHINIRSLDSNALALQDILTEINNNIHIIAMSEVWQNILGRQIQGYQQPVLQLRPSGKGGGVGFFIKKGINFKKINYLTYATPHFEVITIKVCINGREKLIASVYRPPEYNVQTSY